MRQEASPQERGSEAQDGNMPAPPDATDNTCARVGSATDIHHVKEPDRDAEGASEGPEDAAELAAAVGTAQVRAPTRCVCTVPRSRPRKMPHLFVVRFFHQPSFSRGRGVPASAPHMSVM